MYGVFGIPVDAVTGQETVQIIKRAIAQRRPFLISTPNLNFLHQSQSDPGFRHSLLESDLCIPDGMPIVWLSRLVGAPIRERVAGSDLVEALKAGSGQERPVKIFLFGGPEGVAERACASINASKGGLQCVGWHYPGFGDIETMSNDATLATLNASGADFLSVSLGAQKGQAWLLRNHGALHIPVRVHLGATINFEGGTVRRAPRWLRRVGLEWLWRIKEEPHPWQRYAGDAFALAKILASLALPLLGWSIQRRLAGQGQPFRADIREHENVITVAIAGSATTDNISGAVEILRRAIALRQPLRIDLSATTGMDTRFIGLVLMAMKQAELNGGLRLINLPPRIRRFLALNGFGYILET